MSNLSDFQYDAKPFTLANGEAFDFNAYTFLSLIITSGTELEIAPRMARSFGPFLHREIIGDDQEGDIGLVRIRNASGNPVVGSVITSNRRIVWSDKIAIDSSTAVKVTIDGVSLAGTNADAIATAATSVLPSLGYGLVFNGTTWDRVRGEGNNVDGDAVKTAGVQCVESYGMCYNGTTWDRIRGDATGGLYVQGKVNDGSAHGTTKPVLIGGSDGTNAQTISTDASGYVKIIVGTGNLNVAGASWAGQNTITGGVNGTVAVGGTTAHDSAVAGNPIQCGGEARSSDGTAVTSGDVVRQMHNLQGKQVMLPWSLTENLVSGQTAAMTGTADTAMVAGAGAGIKNYLMGVICSNTHATVATAIAIKDGSTEKFRTPVLPAVNGGFSQMFPIPIAGAANAAWNAANITTGSNTYAAAICWKGA